MSASFGRQLLNAVQGPEPIDPTVEEYILGLMQVNKKMQFEVLYKSKHLGIKTS
jgi:hypothetical protein